MKALIFDFDGTLVDSVKSIWEEYGRVMRRMGLPEVPYSEFAKHMGRPWDKVLQGLWPSIDVQEFNRHYNLGAEKVKAMENASDVLEELSGDYELGILTSRGERTLKTHMLNAGIKPGIFKVIMHKDNLLNHKPHPDAITETCSKMGVNKKDAIYVGDSVVDAECARNAGVRFVGVLTGGTEEKEFITLGAEHVIKNIAGLPRLLKKMR